MSVKETTVSTKDAIGPYEFDRPKLAHAWAKYLETTAGVHEYILAAVYFPSFNPKGELVWKVEADVTRYYTEENLDQI